MGRRPAAFLSLLLLVLFFSTGAALAQTGSRPEAPPDASSGREVFNDSCSGCHGTLALGDGDAVDQLAGNLPTALASIDYLRTAVPAEMFTVITEGRIDKLMPPFGSGSANVDPLPESQRWDIIAYIYSLATPVESIENGRIIYEENCLSCHGDGGQGDGPQASELGIEPGNLSDPVFWSQVSNQAVFDGLAGESPIQGHENIIGSDAYNDDEIWSIVDYIRSLSYSYLDAQAPFRPLDAATISGPVLNGTTGEPFTDDGVIADLRAYNQDFLETLLITTTLDSEGTYQFDLADVAQDQFYRVSILYNGVEFGSDFGNVSQSDPDLELPITVFETSDDPSVVGIERLHQILNFFEGGVGVNELYVVNNNSNSVYTGESGNADLGTFEIILPAGAQDISFQRAFGNIDNFIPANEIVPTGRGWADTFPLRPGPSSTILLANYILPYDGGVTISHPVLYATSVVNLALPDAGVTLSDAEEWTELDQRAMGNSNVSNFTKSDIPAGTVLTLKLEGEPDLASTSSGVLALDNQSELLIGLVVALVVVGVAGVFIWKWRQEPAGGELYDSYDREELLQAIADLDDDYELGRISEHRYHSEREQLKSELIALWEEEQLN